jgi:undecaprenyl-diphosphatase
MGDRPHLEDCTPTFRWGLDLIPAGPPEQDPVGVKPVPLILAAILAAVAVHRRRELPRALQVLAATAGAGLLVYGVGLIDPPSAESGIRDMAASLGPYIYVLVGLLALLETGAGVGFVVPGEIAVILGGVSAGQGEIELPILIAVVWCCALAGDLGSFFLARRLGRRFMFVHGPTVGISRARIEQAERFFSAHGGKTIIIGRFIGFVRPLSPFIAGASNMPTRRFIPCTVIASGLWTVAFSVLGYVFSQSLDELLALTGRGAAVLSATLIVAVAVVVTSRRRSSRRARQPARDRQIHVPEPVPARAGGE